MSGRREKGGRRKRGEGDYYKRLQLFLTAFITCRRTHVPRLA